MPPELDLAAILGVLSRNRVRFILIGGMAGVVHGSPFPTEDVDITPEETRENLARLSDALRELDAKVRAAELDEPLPFSHNAESLAAGRVWNLTTHYGDLDISFVPGGTEGYPDLTKDAADVEIAGVVVRVASLADIIRSKRGRQQHRVGPRSG